MEMMDYRQREVEINLIKYHEKIPSEQLFLIYWAIDVHSIDRLEKVIEKTTKPREIR